MPTDRISAARRKAILTRHRTADDPELLEVTRDHAALLIEAYVAKIVESAPPFTESQRARISALLAPAADVAA
jgi:hypothetical protein